MCKAYGADQKVQSIIGTYLSGRKQFVQIDNKKSEDWQTKAGINAGSVLSAGLYNIASATQSIEKKHMAKYADDSGATVEAECSNFEETVEKELSDQLEWYKNAGMKPEWSKIEVLPIKSVMREIEVNERNIKPAQVVKFLGIHIQADGKFGIEVEDRARKLQKQSSWIRSMWYLKTNQRIMVYKALIHGTILSNARIYLPQINAKQDKNLQVAMSSGLRAALGLITKGKVDLRSIRKKFCLPTLKEITRYIAIKGAWSKQEWIAERLQNQGPKPDTRAGQEIKTRRTDSKYEKLFIAEFHALPKSIRDAKEFPKKVVWRHVREEELRPPPKRKKQANIN
jgi:hypothetical protein